MKKFLSVFIPLVSFVASSGAYDSQFLAQHIRKALNLDTRTHIEVSTQPADSGYGHLKVVPIYLNGSPFQIFLPPDEKKYIWGYSIDLTTDPDQVRANAVNLISVHSKGSSSALVTIVEYSDLQCSYCKKAHDTLDENLYRAFDKNQVRLVFKHFPLQGHDWAENAAVAAECVAEQNEPLFWAAIDFFFGNNVRISTANVRTEALQFAKSKGLKTDVFSKCLDSSNAVERVRADKNEGANIGVNSTPSLFINGRMVRGFRSFEDVKIVVEEKLNETKKRR